MVTVAPFTYPEAPPPPAGMDPGEWQKVWAAQNPYLGMPSHPDYSNNYDPSTMSLVDYLTKNYNTTSMKRYQDEALRKGPSAWARSSKIQDKLNQATAHEKGIAQGRGQNALMMDQLASSGGLSSGARERALQSGAQNVMHMGQGLARQGMQNNLQIGINDEQNRMTALSALPGMEFQRAGMFENARGQDISNTANENARRNKFNMDVYDEQMKAWAADRQAKATETSGK